MILKTIIQKRLAFLLLYTAILILGTTSCRTSKVDPYANILDQTIQNARSYKGTRYKWGGMTRKGMDCSGLLYMSWKSVGQNIPRTAKLQSETGKPIKFKDLKRGDMVFFRKGRIGRKITHAGLVTDIRKNKILFIHSSSSRGVVEDDLNSKYWQKHFVKARRILF